MYWFIAIVLIVCVVVLRRLGWERAPRIWGVYYRMESALLWLVIEAGAFVLSFARPETIKRLQEKHDRNYYGEELPKDTQRRRKGDR